VEEEGDVVEVATRFQMKSPKRRVEKRKVVEIAVIETENVEEIGVLKVLERLKFELYFLAIVQKQLLNYLFKLLNLLFPLFIISKIMFYQPPKVSRMVLVSNVCQLRCVNPKTYTKIIP
jgi:hypothetical protein